MVRRRRAGWRLIGARLESLPEDEAVFDFCQARAATFLSALFALSTPRAMEPAFLEEKKDFLSGLEDYSKGDVLLEQRIQYFVGLYYDLWQSKRLNDAKVSSRAHTCACRSRLLKNRRPRRRRRKRLQMVMLTPATPARSVARPIAKT